LRFSVRESPSLPEGLKARLARLAGARMTQDGVLVISAKKYRSQQRNRQDAQERLFELIRAAAAVPKRRRATRPTLASKERRLTAKSVRSGTKSMRARPDQD
jgi:ribosome-associated protein